MRFLLTGLICLSCSIGLAQKNINQQAGDSYKRADKELNEVYNQILTEYKLDTAFIRNLRASQRIWIKFRDAELKVKYPDRGIGHYGSIHSVCVANYLEQLTRDRTGTLRQWVEGIQEGNVCGGSIKLKK